MRCSAVATASSSASWMASGPASMPLGGISSRGAVEITLSPVSATTSAGGVSAAGSCARAAGASPGNTIKLRGSSTPGVYTLCAFNSGASGATSGDATLPQQIAMTAWLLAIFLPFSYFMDSFMYRRYVKRTGVEPTKR